MANLFKAIEWGLSKQGSNPWARYRAYKCKTYGMAMRRAFKSKSRSGAFVWFSDIKAPSVVSEEVHEVSHKKILEATFEDENWLRGQDSNLRPSGYEPDQNSEKVPYLLRNTLIVLACVV